MTEDQPHPLPPPLPDASPVVGRASSRTVGRWLAVAAGCVVFIAAVILLVDIMRPVETVQLSGGPNISESGVLVHLSLKGTSQSFDASPTLVVTLNNEPYPRFIDLRVEEFAAKFERYCLEEIVLAAQVIPGFDIQPQDTSTGPIAFTTNRLFFEDPQNRYLDNRCVDAERRDVEIVPCCSETFSAARPEFPVVWRSNNGASLFPFDVWQGTVGLAANVRLNDTELLVLAPAVTLTPVSNNWDISGTLGTVTTAQPIPERATVLTLTVQRPLSVRLFTGFLLLSVFALELAIFFIADQNTAIGVIVGVIFGLWSIHELLVPPGMPAVNLVRSIILFLYVVLVVVALLRFFAKPLLEAADETTVTSEASADDHRTD